ncbi:MAG: hypothetical protein FWG20_06425 [Candidatus Cloacimonetes bacterium]|nr:hypothetical protein [Candidatus Cloacimonadota bacterium]
MENKIELDIIETLKEGVGIAIKSAIPIIVNVVLWVVTIWIPYLNIGTTIGLFVGIILKLGRGEEVSPTEIFNPIYRKYMGEYLLTLGLYFIGVFAGMLFFVIPGLVMTYSWRYATLQLIDKEVNPMEALTLSNKLTYGNKLRMLVIYLLFGIVVGILNLLVAKLGIFFTIVVTCATIFIQIGIDASIYQQLTAGKAEVLDTPQQI